MLVVALFAAIGFSDEMKVPHERLLLAAYLAFARLSARLLHVAVLPQLCISTQGLGAVSTLRGPLILASATLDTMARLGLADKSSNPGFPLLVLIV